MKRAIVCAACACYVALCTDSSIAQTPILQPNEPLIAVDITPSNLSDYPGGESPAKAIDGIIPPMGSGTGNKYLNFGQIDTGLLVTPVAGATTVTGIQLATANDAIGFRDPKTYAI